MYFHSLRSYVVIRHNVIVGAISLKSCARISVQNTVVQMPESRISSIDGAWLYSPKLFSVFPGVLWIVDLPLLWPLCQGVR
jgi:hypothetical protein